MSLEFPKILPAGAFILVLALAACGSDNQAPKFVESAKAFMARKDYPSALIQLRNAAQEQPENPEIRFLLGTALRQTPELAQAEAELRKARSLGYPADAIASPLIGVLLETAQFAKALEEIETLAPGMPARKGEFAALRGDALAGLGRRDDAAAAYSAALEAEPRNVVAAIGQAGLALAAGDLPGAESRVDSVLAAAPDTVQALIMKAGLEMRRGRTAEAAAAYEKALLLRPDDVRATSGLVPILLSQGKIDAAATRVASLAKRWPSAPAGHYLDSLVAYARGDRAHARDSILLVLKVLPDDLRALLLGGSIEHDLGNYATAEQMLKRVVAASPSDIQSRRLLASTLVRTGQGARAREVLEPLLKSGTADATVLLLAGEVEEQAGDYRKALSLFERALALEAGLFEASIGAARVRLRAGDAERAVADLEAVARADAKRAGADLLLVDWFLARGQLDRAQSAAEALVRKLPDDPRSHHTFGLVRLARKDAAGARAAFDKAISLAPRFLPAARSLAALDVGEGKTDAAQERYRAMLAQDPRQPEIALLLTGVLRTRGAPAEQVLKVLDQAIADNATSGPLMLAKIDYLMTLGDQRAALDAAVAARTALPEDPTVVFALARMQQLGGDPAAAADTYGKLAGLEPRSPVPFMGLAEARSAQKNWTEARDALLKALEIKPDLVPARVALVDMGIRSGEHARARADAQTLQRLVPGSGAGYLAEARVLAATADLAGSERILRQGFVKTADLAMAGALYGNLLAQGRAADADREASELLAKHPGDLRILLPAGDARLARKEYREAETWYRLAVKARPDDPTALNNLAWVLGKLGESSALEVGRRALEKSPRSAALLDTVGMLNVQFGKIDEGVRQLETAVAQAPGAASIRINLARALVRAGRKDEARQQLEEALRHGSGETLSREVAEVRATL